MKIRLGLTQAAIKFNLHNKDCISLIEAVSLFNQTVRSDLISTRLSGVTSKVMFSVLNKIPINVIIVEGGQAFSTDSSIPHLHKIFLNVVNPNSANSFFSAEPDHQDSLILKCQF